MHEHTRAITILKTLNIVTVSFEVYTEPCINSLMNVIDAKVR